MLISFLYSYVTASDDEPKMSSYEAERLKKIQQNQEFLQKLGLSTVVTDLKEQIQEDLTSSKKRKDDDNSEYFIFI